LAASVTGHCLDNSFAITAIDNGGEITMRSDTLSFYRN
jgi:hypothetical protein